MKGTFFFTRTLALSLSLGLALLESPRHPCSGGGAGHPRGRGSQTRVHRPCEAVALSLALAPEHKSQRRYKSRATLALREGLLTPPPGSGPFSLRPTSVRNNVGLEEELEGALRGESNAAAGLEEGVPWYRTPVEHGIPPDKVAGGLHAIRQGLPWINQQVEPDQQLKAEDVKERVVNQYRRAVEQFNRVILNGPMTAVDLQNQFLKFHAVLGGGNLIQRAGRYDQEKKDVVRRLFQRLFSEEGDRAVAANPIEMAAEVFVTLVNLQGFHDGNKRAASLMMNYLLLKSGHTPFILSDSNAVDYLKIVNSPDLDDEEFEVNEREFAEFLESQVKPLRRSATHPPAAGLEELERTPAAGLEEPPLEEWFARSEPLDHGRLLEGDVRILYIGDKHSWEGIRRSLIRALPVFGSRGVTHLFLEALPMEAQKDLDAYLRAAEAEIPAIEDRLAERWLSRWRKNYGTKSADLTLEMVKAARRNQIRVVALWRGEAHRGTNEQWAQVIREEMSKESTGKAIVFAGRYHLGYEGNPYVDRPSGQTVNQAVESLPGPPLPGRVVHWIHGEDLQTDRRQILQSRNFSGGIWADDVERFLLKSQPPLLTDSFMVPVEGKNYWVADWILYEATPSTDLGAAGPVEIGEWVRRMLGLKDDEGLSDRLERLRHGVEQGFLVQRGLPVLARLTEATQQKRRGIALASPQHFLGRQIAVEPGVLTGDVQSAVEHRYGSVQELSTATMEQWASRLQERQKAQPAVRIKDLLMVRAGSDFARQVKELLEKNDADWRWPVVILEIPEAMLPGLGSDPNSFLVYLFELFQKADPIPQRRMERLEGILTLEEQQKSFLLSTRA